jgi:hypothetical protein
LFAWSLNIALSALFYPEQYQSKSSKTLLNFKRGLFHELQALLSSDSTIIQLAVGACNSNSGS